jgi:xanthine dehydrogenase YagR molybdenum-binding subunit
VANAQQPGAPPPAPPGPTANAKKYAWPEKPAVLSTRVKRLDGPDKVAGRAKYSFDINRPGMIFGKIVRSPHPHARVTAVDLSDARRAPGVKAALVWKEPGTTATSEVRYQGEPIAAIAAETEEQAIDAARMVKVTYDVLEHVASEQQAMASDAPVVFQGGNTRKGAAQETGDLDAGFKAAAHIVEQTYATHVITHVCMESHGCVCEWDGDKLTAWVSTQGVHGTKDGFAQGLKIPGANVRVITQ